MTEKELVEKVLRDRAIVKSDNTLDKMRYMKLITEPWIRKRVETYGWLKQPICAIEKTADLSAENKPIDETLKTVEKVPQIENKEPENAELTTTVPEQEKPIVEELSLEKFVVDPVVLKTAVVEEPVEEKVAEEPASEETVEETVIPEPVEETIAEENTTEIEQTKEPASEEVVEETVVEEPATEEVVEETVEEPATEEVVVEETSEAPAPKKTRKKKS